MRGGLFVLTVVLGVVAPQCVLACDECGCHGGPGYRGQGGHCVGWAKLSHVCGDPATTRCSYERGTAAPAGVASLIALHYEGARTALGAPVPAEVTTANPAINPAVTEATLSSTVCISGWTTTVRSFFASQRAKLEKMKALGATDATAFELDHVVPLCAGGSVDDPSNLQLQPWAEATRKDRLEVQACRCLCGGKVSLAEVQADFKGDWKVAYAKYAKMVCHRTRD
jgi:hypothetical protein